MNRSRLSSGLQQVKDRVVRLSKREYCAWANPYLKCLYRPLSVLSLAGVASLLCGLFVAPQGLVVFAAILAVIAIGCVWPWLGMRGVSCRLRFTSARTEEGKPVEAELEITNRWPWPVWGLSIEGGFCETEQGTEDIAIAVPRVGGWSRGSFRWDFTPSLRGRYPQGSPQLATEFPFGLWKAKRRVEVLSTLIVWPERFTLPPLVLPCGAQSWAGQPNDFSTGTMGHRTAVREYRRSDSMRQIHWAKTALYDKLISFDREGLAVADAIISLDAHPVLHRGTGRQSSFEWTIRIAASISETLLRQGVNVTVASQVGQFHAHSNGSQPTSLMDWFALLNMSQRAMDSATRSRLSGKNSQLSIRITTDQCKDPSGNSIVYLTEPTDSVDGSSNLGSHVWMTLNKEADIQSQILRGWRNGPRSYRHAI